MTCHDGKSASTVPAIIEIGADCEIVQDAPVRCIWPLGISLASNGRRHQNDGDPLTVPPII